MKRECRISGISTRREKKKRERKDEAAKSDRSRESATANGGEMIWYLVSR
jgi:hypothetical protein